MPNWNWSSEILYPSLSHSFLSPIPFISLTCIGTPRTALLRGRHLRLCAPFLLMFNLFPKFVFRCWAYKCFSSYSASKKLNYAQCRLFSQTWPFARCASAANSLPRYADVFNSKMITLKKSFNYYFHFYLVKLIVKSFCVE